MNFMSERGSSFYYHIGGCHNSSTNNFFKYTIVPYCFLVQKLISHHLIFFKFKKKSFNNTMTSACVQCGWSALCHVQKLMLSAHVRLGPGHTKDFFGVLAKTRGISLGFLDIRGRRQIFLDGCSFCFGVDSA